MPLKLRYLQFCRNSLCLLICLLSFIVFYLLPLTEAILSGLQGSFSFLFHYIFHCCHHHFHIHIYTRTHQYIYMCSFHFKYLSIFTSFLWLLKSMTKSMSSELSCSRRETVRFSTNVIFLLGYSSYFRAYLCKKDSASVSGKCCLFFMNMCMHDELGFFLSEKCTPWQLLRLIGDKPILSSSMFAYIWCMFLLLVIYNWLGKRTKRKYLICLEKRTR